MGQEWEVIQHNQNNPKSILNIKVLQFLPDCDVDDITTCFKDLCLIIWMTSLLICGVNSLNLYPLPTTFVIAVVCRGANTRWNCLYSKGECVNYTLCIAVVFLMNYSTFYVYSGGGDGGGGGDSGGGGGGGGGDGISEEKDTILFCDRPNNK